MGQTPLPVVLLVLLPYMMAGESHQASSWGMSWRLGRSTASRNRPASRWNAMRTFVIVMEQAGENFSAYARKFRVA